MHNGSYDGIYFIRNLCPTRNYLYDSMLMLYSRFSHLPKTLDFVSSILLEDYQYWKDDIKGTDNKGQVLRNLERYWRYNALDTRNTLFNTLLLIQLMKLSPQMQRNYNDTFMRNLSAISMSMKGVKADFKQLEEHRTQLQSEVDKRSEESREGKECV